MALTSVKELRDGLSMVESVLQYREMMAQDGESPVVKTLLSTKMKPSEDYLFFAKALDSLRTYAAGPKLIPGTSLHHYAQSLIKKMEELDGLTAQMRAGVPENHENPYIMSDISGALDDFAKTLYDVIGSEVEEFKLENEDIELLKSLDGMVQHLGLPVKQDWEVLKTAIPRMSEPAVLDDSIFDTLQTHWKSKMAVHDMEVLMEQERKNALSDTETPIAMQLATSRAAAKADMALQEGNPKAAPSAAGMLYRKFFSTCTSLIKYREKYLDSMSPEDSEALQKCIDGFLNAEDALAGSDTRLEEDAAPNLYEAEEYVTLDLWPGVVDYFTSHKPNIRVSDEDAVLIRRLYELQKALGLPEKIDNKDMREVYNFVQDVDYQHDPDSAVMKDAAKFWESQKKKRFDETEEGKALIESEKVRLQNEENEKIEAERQKKLKEEEDRKALEEAEAARQKKLKDEADRQAREKAEADLKKELEEKKILEDQEKAKEDQLRKEDQEFLQSIVENIPGYQDPKQQEEFDDIIKFMDEENPERKQLRDQQRKEEEEAKLIQEAPLPVPSPDDKTWGEYAKELEAYLKQQRNLIPVSGSNIEKPRLEEYPHITQVVHALVAINRYGSEELKNEIVNTRELTSEGKQLLGDPVFKKVLENPEDNQWLQAKEYKIFWKHLLDASREQYKSISQQQGQRVSSPYDISVVEMRNWVKNSELDKEKPFRKNIGNIVERLDNARYNADIQKTGFLFFKPSDTGLFQTAVEKLKAIAQADPGQTVRNSAKNEAYLAVKAYLDDRKSVRSHEYGKRRWEKMMCAYAALETPEKFAAYCKELNEYRKIDNPMDPDYVSPEAFGPGRMDLANPQIPLREARAQVLKEYKEPLPENAGTADKDLWYFARVAVMRNTATKQNDWGALVDMKQVDEQARQLVQEKTFADLIKSDKFKNGDTAERQSLYETAEKLLAPKDDQWQDDMAELAKKQRENELKREDELKKKAKEKLY